MSDTDDTDSLLSVAAPSGLTNFLGLSVDEMSSRIDSLTNNSNSNLFNNNHNDSRRTLTQEDVKQAEFVKNDILSQLAEYSDSDDDDDDGKSDSGSVASTASTNSITMLYPSEAKDDEKAQLSVKEPSSVNVVPVARRSPASNHEHDNSSQNSNQIVTVRPIEDKYKLPTYGVRVSHGVDFLRQSPHTTGWRYTTAEGNDLQIISRAPNFRTTPGGYKPPLIPPVPRDLTDAEVHEEVKKMYAFPDDDCIDSDDNADDNNKYKNISASAIDSNNKLTGDHAASDGGGSDNKHGNADNTADIDSQVIQNDKKISVSLTGGTNSNSVLVDSCSGGGDRVLHEVKENDTCTGGKPVKRKLFSVGDTVGSIPDLGFGLRNFDKLEVREKPVVPSQAWLSDVHRGQRAQCDKPFTASSAQFRDENDLEISPIKAAYLESSKNSSDYGRCLPRARQLKKNVTTSSPRKVSLLELDLLWKDIQRTKSAMEEEMNKESTNLKAVAATLQPKLSPDTESANQESKSHGKVSFQVANTQSQSEAVTPSLASALENLSIEEVGNSRKHRRQQKSILKSKSGNKKLLKANRATSSTSSTPKQSSYISDSISYDLNSTGDDFTMMSLYDSAALPTDLDTIDFSSILSAAHIRPSEFDDILSRLDDFSDAAIEQMTGADDEIEDVVTKLEVTDWAKSGATEYLQKYYDEKNRRDLCESENGILNKVVLKLKEELAVTTKMLNKKDRVLLKMTKAWHDVSNRWKIHENQSREILQKLQQDQASLLESSRKSKERIDCYEKELGNALDLAAGFKCKLEALEKANCDNMEKLEGENRSLKENFDSLEHTLNSIKDEKDAAVRALSESQKQLDEQSSLHKEVEEKLMFVQLEAEEDQKDFMKVIEQKRALEEYLQSVTIQKDSLETQIGEVLEKLENEKAEKERLELMVTQKIQSQVQAEKEGLQKYYSLKLQQQSEEAIAKEVAVVNNHQQELMILEKKLLKMLEECKKSCYTEMNQKQRLYEKEIRGLREELAHKQRFISKMSREFYEQTEAIKETDQSACERERIAMNKQTSSVVNRQFGNDNIDASRCSSSDSFSQKTPKSQPVSKDYDDDGSSIVEFDPSKLGKYNISTPTSDLVAFPTTIATATKMKGWRELPNIQHLLTPVKDEPCRIFSMISNAATIMPSDKENQLIMAPSNAISTSTMKNVQATRNISSNHSQLNSTPEQAISEQRIRKCMHTLMKVYRSRLNDESNNSKGDQNSNCQSTQAKSMVSHAASPLTTTKLIQQKDFLHHDGVPSLIDNLAEPAISEHKSSGIPHHSSHLSFNSNKDHGKQPLKPPWK